MGRILITMINVMNAFFVRLFEIKRLRSPMLHNWLWMSLVVHKGLLYFS